MLGRVTLCRCYISLLRTLKALICKEYSFLIPVAIRNKHSVGSAVL